MGRDNIMTSGLVYRSVIERERNLEYGGKDVQMMSDIPDEVIRRLKLATNSKADFVLVEIGGTAGDVENLVFLEAARVLKLADPDHVLFVLVSHLPVLNNTGEMKSKPTQHAVRALSSVGIQADIIIASFKRAHGSAAQGKISRLCNVHAQDIISAPDVGSIYEVPLNFERDHIVDRILYKVKLKPKRHNHVVWRHLVQSIHRVKKTG